MRLSWGLVLGIAAGFTFAGTSAARANFILNPGFTPAVKLHGSFYHRRAKASNQPLSNWTITGAIDIASSKHWQTTGTSGYSVDLIGSPGLGAVQQTITGLTAGDVYALSFDVATNPAKNSKEFKAVKELAVGLVGSDQTQPTVFDLTTPSTATRKNMQYQPETISFTATGTSVTLILAAQTSTNLPRHKNASKLFCGPVVSNLDMEFVSATSRDTGNGPTPAPEPASLALLGIGGLGLLKRRRSR